MADSENNSASVNPQENQRPSGFTCECGEFHPFGAYVIGHWRDRLIHTCWKCDRRHSVLRGDVRLIPSRQGGERLAAAFPRAQEAYEK